MSSVSPSSIANVFLIGYRGTGKSTVGTLLAERLGWEFVDADGFLEAHYGLTIRDIFASEGESGFREKESEILRLICEKTEQVVGTGGGVILRPENREMLKNAGTVVWLTGKPQTLWARIQGDQSTAARRPNLTRGGLEEIQELLDQRLPLYEACADYTLETDETTPEELADKIVELLHG